MVLSLRGLELTLQFTYGTPRAKAYSTFYGDVKDMKHYTHLAPGLALTRILVQPRLAQGLSPLALLKSRIQKAGRIRLSFCNWHRTNAFGRKKASKLS